MCAVLEILLKPLFEIFSFVTGVIIVPLITLGFVRVAVSSEILSKSIEKEEGGYVIDMFLASIIAMLFWIVVGLLFFIFWM